MISKPDELQQSIVALLSTEEGKRVVFWLLEMAGVYRDAFSGDAAATNYTLGQQSIGRRILTELNAIDPRIYPRLLLDIAEIKEMGRAAARNEEKDDDDEA